MPEASSQPSDEDPVQERIDEVITLWDEARDRGEDIDPAELCRECPDLLAEVKRRIQALQHWNALADTSTGDLPRRVPEPSGDPGSAVVTMRLENLKFHARGGLGTVFKAPDYRLGRDLALKFPGESSSTFAAGELRLRFLREVAVTASLEHPGIVPVHGLGQDAGGRLCYAMRFVTGKTLKAAIAEYHAARQARSLPLRVPLRRDAEFRSLLQRFRSACVTVAYAHSRGFLHRDLKPEHILLGDFDVTLVVDWGLTKRYGDHEITPCSPRHPSADGAGGEAQYRDRNWYPGFRQPRTAGRRLAAGWTRQRCLQPGGDPLRPPHR